MLNTPSLKAVKGAIQYLVTTGKILGYRGGHWLNLNCDAWLLGFVGPLGCILYSLQIKR